MYTRARRTRPRAAAVLGARRERRRRIFTSNPSRVFARAPSRVAHHRVARGASPHRHVANAIARAVDLVARARATRPARRDATLEFSRHRNAPIRVVESVNIARRGVRRVDVASARRVRRKSRNASRHTDTKKRSRKSDGNARRHFFAMRSPASKARRWVRARDDDGDDAVTVTVEARPRGEKEKRRRGTAVDALRDGSDDLRDGTRWYIDPRHAPRMAWDRASVVFVMFNMIVLPFDAAFWAGAPASLGVRATRGVGYFIDAFFGVDVVLNFYTAYYDASDRLVRSRELIARNYVFSGAFFVDLCGSFPFEVVMTSSSAGLAALVKVTRLLRVRRVYSFFEKNESPRSVTLFRIAQLFILVLLAIHFIACAWALVCRGDGETLAWCSADELSVGAKYAFATNDAVGFLLGNGLLGDVGDENQRVAETIILLFCGVLYCTVFGNVASLVSALMSRNEQYDQTLSRVNDVMRYAKVDEELADRVRQYHEYLWLRFRDVKVGGIASIAQNLPTSLRHELLLHAHRDMLRKVPIFALAAPSVILDIVLRLRTEVALPGDILLRRGEEVRGIFFLGRGVVEVLAAHALDVQDKQRVANEDGISRRKSVDRICVHEHNPILRDGSYFGERGLILREPAMASVVAQTFCELHVLSADDFDQILARSPELEEYMVRARFDLFHESSPRDAPDSRESREESVQRRLAASRASRAERLRSVVARPLDPPSRPRALDASDDDVSLADISRALARVEDALADARRARRVARAL